MIYPLIPIYLLLTTNASTENTVDRGQVKIFENLIVWQKTIHPLIPIYSLLTTNASTENTVDRGQVKIFENLIVWQKTIHPLIPIYLLLTTKLIDVFGNDTNKIIKVRIK